MTEKDYYEILGVPIDADSATIKKAYRNLAMNLHPDRNQNDPEATERMKEINEAYAVLSDREKRQLYDTYGHDGLRGYSQEDIFRGIDFARLFHEFGMRDILDSDDSLLDGFFGRASSRTERHGSGDLHVNLAMSLEETLLGVEKSLEVPKAEECPVCKGAGAEQDGLQQCDQCKGTGQIVDERKKGYTIYRQIFSCPKCHGKGCLIKRPCQKCDGQGVIERIDRIDVKIPAGIDTGFIVKVEGKGRKGKDGPGDLYVVVEVQDHPIFERHGDDVFCRQEIPLVTAALGGEIEVPDLEGSSVRLAIPEGTQTGGLFKIDGHGIPHLHEGGRGDEYVMAKVMTPTNLTESQKELLRRFETLGRLEAGSIK